MAKNYVLIKNKVKGKVSGYHFHVPNHIGDLIPEGATFVPTLTNEGILYKIILPQPAPETEVNIPDWAKK